MRYLGQHFLVQKNIVKKIADVAELNKNDVVLEVGPGKGILTEELLNRVKKVIAVEKDRKLCEFLNDKFKKEIEEKRLELTEGDILKIQNAKIKNQNDNVKLKIPKKYKIVANIPYYITSRFLKIFLEEAEIQPEKMVLMLQKEVAKRICETPAKSILAVSVQAYGKPKIALRVSAGSFFPQPKIDSAVIVINEISKKFFNGIIEKKFFSIVKIGFSKKRKILFNNLTELPSKYGGRHILKEAEKKESLKNAFKKCGIDDLSRAENLTLKNWKCLCKCAIF